VVGGEEVEMQSGEMLDFTSSETLVEFDRGGDFGLARYTLRPGSYRFTVSADGWQLYRITFEATLDNTASAQDFHLVAGDESMIVGARTQHVVQPEYPIVVTFDNGSGESVAKQLADDEVYTIGIESRSGLWDLFPGTAAASGAAATASGEGSGDNFDQSLSGF
jgi:hypothetical protein